MMNTTIHIWQTLFVMLRSQGHTTEPSDRRSYILPFFSSLKKKPM